MRPTGSEGRFPEARLPPPTTLSPPFVIPLLRLLLHPQLRVSWDVPKRSSPLVTQEGPSQRKTLPSLLNDSETTGRRRSPPQVSDVKNGPLPTQSPPTEERRRRRHLYHGGLWEETETYDPGAGDQDRCSGVRDPRGSRVLVISRVSSPTKTRPLFLVGSP